MKQKAKWYEVVGCVFGGRIAARTIKAMNPEAARKKMRAKFTRGAFAGYPLSVRETGAPARVLP